VAIVGAGLTGLVAARLLQERGVEVVVLDRDPHPGGRLATGRLGGATVDYGAQFFTVRSDAFRAAVDAWRQVCPVTVWCHGFLQADDVRDGPESAREAVDGYPRYAVGGGMGTLAAQLARGVDVRGGVMVSAVRRSGRGWRVEIGGAAGGGIEAAAVIVTPPVPQSVALLAAGGAALGPALAGELGAIRYDPCIALLAALDRPPAVPAPGGAQFARGAVSWLADNVAKGASAAPAVTVHASAEWSLAHEAEDDAAAVMALLDETAGWLGTAEPLEVAVRRWPDAKPREPHPRRCVLAVDDPALVLAGDGFGESRVEGATLSGLSAAEALLAAG
jgi:predicted NAD/FAD-dependent oxidoreductase